jgi:hypothetical protein
MRYLYAPTDTAPRVIDADLTDSRISDELGGTYVKCAVSDNLALHMRDDVAGLPFNPAATHLITLTRRRPFPVYGPAIVTSLDVMLAYKRNGRSHSVSGHTASLTVERAQAGVEIAEDGYLAYHGSILSDGHVYTGLVRRALAATEQIELPAGWPGNVEQRAMREVHDLHDVLAEAGVTAERGEEATSPDGPFYI